MNKQCAGISSELLDKINQRISSIEGCQEFKPHFSGHKHLDIGASERAYWHAGYSSALRDLLTILQGTRKDFN